jgi:hypothetical protein
MYFRKSDKSFHFEAPLWTFHACEILMENGRVIRTENVKPSVSLSEAKTNIQFIGSKL